MFIQWIAIGQIFLIAVLWITASIGFRDFDIIKFELQQLSDVPITGTLKMFRGENRDHKFNLTATITSDDLSIYDVEAILYRSAVGNNHFVLSPYKLPKKPLCDFFNKEYRERVMDDIASYSNFPNEQDPKINYCDLLKKGNHYELMNYAGNVSKVPPYAPTGTFKFIGNLIDRNTKATCLSVLVITKLY